LSVETNCFFSLVTLSFLISPYYHPTVVQLLVLVTHTATYLQAVCVRSQETPSTERTRLRWQHLQYTATGARADSKRGVIFVDSKVIDAVLFNIKSTQQATAVGWFGGSHETP
jgi:hypothetical protein